MREKSFIICYLLFAICTLKADWVQVNNGLTEWHINTLTATGNYIFAGTASTGGVFVSTNNGDSWVLTPLHTTTLALASNGNYIYAGYQNGLSYSTNYGASWNFSDLNLWVNAILANGNYVYAGCRDTGVYISTNYGSNWLQSSLNNKIIYAFTLTGNNLFAGGQGIYLSTNTGTNWQLSLLTGPYALASNGNFVFAGLMGGSGVMASTNSGVNWSQTSLNNHTIQALTVSGNNVFAGGGSGIYISNDNGANWLQRNEGMGNYYTLSLCISNGFLFAGTDGIGVWRRPLSELVGIKIISQQVPTYSELNQNYPNPFNPATNIKYQITKSGNVIIKIYNILGKEISTPVNQKQSPGTYEISWDGNNYPNGVYFYRLIADNKIIDTKKMILNK